LRLRQIAFRLIGLAILALILVKADLKATVAALAGLHWGYLLLAIAANVPMFGLKAWRWQEMLRMQGIRYPWRDAFLVFMAGLFLGLVTPGRVGEMSKALYLKQDRSVPISVGLANVLMDRLFDLYTILVLGAAGLIWFRLLPDWVLALILAGTTASIALPVILLNKPLAAWTLSLARRMPVLRRYDARLTAAAGRFQEGLRPLLALRLVIPLLLTQIAYLIFFWQGQLLATAVGLRIGIGYLAMCLSVAGVITLLPISISGLGTRDAALIAMLAPLGISASHTIAFSSLYFLTFYVIGGAIGAVAWQLKPLRERVPTASISSDSRE
jgi:glycosyltransferase 2 family protein